MSALHPVFAGIFSAHMHAASAEHPEDEAVKPLRIDWNKHDLAEAYDLVEGVRIAAGQPAESPIHTALCAALDAIEAADCEWDGITLPEGQSYVPADTNRRSGDLGAADGQAPRVVNGDPA